MASLEDPFMTFTWVWFTGGDLGNSTEKGSKDSKMGQKEKLNFVSLGISTKPHEASRVVLN